MKEVIKEELKSLADENYKKFHKTICNSKKEILGVRIPKIREYAKKLLKNYKVKELLEQIDNEYYEEIMLKGLIIGLDKDKNIENILINIEKFVPEIDNWAICDTFCAGLKITKKNLKEMWKFLQKYLKSSEEYEIRFAIVMILDYYITEEYIRQDLKIFENINSEKYYVQMAIAWAISICLIKFYDITKEYLERTNIDKFIFNKAIQKAIESYRITDIQKEELRKMKKR